MRVIIAGAGEVGFHIAKMICGEAHDIYVVDNSKERLNYVQSGIDVFCMEGDAKELKLLRELKAQEADLLVAATSSEETNLLICMLGKKLGAKKTIARISNYEAIGADTKSLYYELGVDTIVSPVELASDEIKRLIHQPAFTDDFEFEGGKLSVFGIAIPPHSPLANKSVIETAHLNPNLSFKPVVLVRDHHTIMVQAKTVIEPNDIVYFISTPESIENVIEICGKTSFNVKNVMILGGSKMGVLTAEVLEKDFNVILIERDKKKAGLIAEHLEKTLVIHADGRDVSILEEESIEDMDAFIAVTGDSETNIMSCLVAKSHGVRKTIADIENIDYINLSHNVGIDTLINKKMIAANEIFKFIRKGKIDAIANLRGVDIEIIEFNITHNAPITTKALREFKFPESTNIAGVIRNGEGIIPFGGFKVQPNDKVIIFTPSGAIPDVEKFFS